MRTVVTIILMSFALLSHSQVKNNTDVSEGKNWDIKGGLHLWFLKVDATIKSPSFWQEKPINDESTLKLNNSLTFAIAADLEIKHKKWIGAFNLSHFVIDGEDYTADEIITVTVSYRLEQTFGNTKFGYQFLEKGDFELDGFLGIQFNYTQLTGSAFVGQGDVLGGYFSRYNIDPIIAVRLHYLPHPRFETMVYADYGILSSSDNLTSQFWIEENFSATQWLYLSIGYKYWLYKQSGNDINFKGNFHGLYARLGIQF